MNICTNVVRLIVAMTELVVKNWKHQDLTEMHNQIPLGRLAQPIDIV